MTLRSLNGIYRGTIKQPIYSDLYAIRRNPDGDYFNMLDTLARDGDYVLGRTYLPPLTYDGLDLEVRQWGVGVIKRSLRLVVIRGDTVLAPGLDYVPVVPPPLPASQIIERYFFAPRTFEIKEGQLTRLTLVFNMDSVFAQRIETLEFTPSFYISTDN
jgi:hypothetical protein